MIEDLIILGTGNANALECYNSCFAIRCKKETFLIDAGGGNGILLQLKKAEIPLESIHHVFLSHAHTDHILGMVWVIRMICASIRKGTYEGKLTIYCHKELAHTLQTIVSLTLPEKFVKLIGKQVLLCQIKDGESTQILGHAVSFFDIQSTKAKQFGFQLTLMDSRRLVFIGDEPYREHERKYAKEADWLLHEAFCLYEEADKFHPYEKHHSTVIDACKSAEELGVKNLILYHTEDKSLSKRKERYIAEGEKYFKGNLYVPEDLERFKL